jgi:hypothetical protein
MAPQPALAPALRSAIESPVFSALRRLEGTNTITHPATRWGCRFPSRSGRSPLGTGWHVDMLKADGRSAAIGEDIATARRSSKPSVPRVRRRLASYPDRRQWGASSHRASERNSSIISTVQLPCASAAPRGPRRTRSDSCRESEMSPPSTTDQGTLSWHIALASAYPSTSY